MEYEVEYDDTTEAYLEFTNSNIDLVTGKQTATVLNETAPVTEFQVEKTLGKASSSSQYTLCTIWCNFGPVVYIGYFITVYNSFVSAVETNH